MEKREILFKTQPSYFFLFIYLIGAAFFAFWAKALYFANWKVQGASEKSGDIIILCLLILFILFSVSCIICLVGFRVFIITERALIIKRPLLFISKRALFSDIISITEKDITIDLSKSVFSNNELTIGKKAIIKLADNKRINISSIEIKGVGTYRDLIKNLYKGIRV